MELEKKSQAAIFNILLFGGALIVLAVLFPTIIDVIEGSRAETEDTTAILIYDILPFAIGILIFIGFIGAYMRLRSS